VRDIFAMCDRIYNMDEFAKMDIFFVIASIGFVVMTIAMLIIGIALHKLVRKLRDIANDAKEISEDAKDVAGELRDDIVHARSAISGLISFFSKKKKGSVRKRGSK